MNIYQNRKKFLLVSTYDVDVLIGGIKLKVTHFQILVLTVCLATKIFSDAPENLK